MTLTSILLTAIMALGLTQMPAADRLDHREDFKMNGISGGDFRSYIQQNIPEDDIWAHSMRTFGSFHNHMHVMMGNLARYAADETGTADYVPDFGARISGGDWSEYRYNLELAGVASTWREFVQITEIMHDRVHHAMYKATIYDVESRGRIVELGDYVGDRAPHPSDETVIDRGDLHLVQIDPDDFRFYVWDHEFENQYLFDSMQNMQVFSEKLYGLMNRWAAYGATKDAADCRPPAYGHWISGAEWAEYASRVANCEDEAWRELVQVVDLMHARIHHMMAMMVRHDAAEQGRLDVVGHMLH